MFGRATITLGVGPHSSYGRPIGQTIIFLPYDFFLYSSLFPRLISAVADWTSAIHGVALVII